MATYGSPERMRDTGPTMESRRNAAPAATRLRSNASIVALFVVLIWLPLAANLAGVDGADPAAENRELAAFPA